MAEDIYFYRSTGKYGFLSNLFHSSLTFEERSFPTAEHAYQFKRFVNRSVAEWVMKAPAPRFVALVSHNLFPYDEIRDWGQIKVPRMRRVLLAKFTQNPDLGTKLIETGKAMLIENSKSDGFWGIGRNSLGRNMLGTLLMQVRAEIVIRR